MKLNIEFNGNPTNLKVFLESLCYHACTSSWMQFITIPEQNGTHCPIIDEHGLLTVLDVNTAVDKYHERSYCNTQDYYKLCMCLLDSITRDDFLKVNTNAEQYLTGATEDPGGVCFLLLLIQSFTIHTRATVKTIQKSLYTLDSQNG